MAKIPTVIWQVTLDNNQDIYFVTHTTMYKWLVANNYINDSDVRPIILTDCSMYARTQWSWRNLMKEELEVYVASHPYASCTQFYKGIGFGGEHLYKYREMAERKARYYQATYITRWVADNTGQFKMVERIDVR